MPKLKRAFTFPVCTFVQKYSGSFKSVERAAVVVTTIPNNGQCPHDSRAQHLPTTTLAHSQFTIPVKHKGVRYTFTLLTRIGFILVHVYMIPVVLLMQFWFNGILIFNRTHNELHKSKEDLHIIATNFIILFVSANVIQCLRNIIKQLYTIHNT